MVLFIARVVFIDFYSLLLLPFMPFGHDQQIYTDIDTTPLRTGQTGADKKFKRSKFQTSTINKV